MNTPILNSDKTDHQIQRNPVFIHSLWRSGSTYLFSVFRRSNDGYFAYQEPVHEIALLSKNNPENLLSFISESMSELRHPHLTESYFAELYEVSEHWRNIIQKSIIYDEYFFSSSDLINYLNSLIDHAKGRPVIQECRTSCRIGQIKTELGGVHIYLWRNPWDQWWSYKSTSYFDITSQLILNAAKHPNIIDRLRLEIGFKERHSDDIHQEFAHFDRNRLSTAHSYLVFYTLWCLGLFEGMGQADLLLNIDTLSNNADYKKQIEKQFKTLNLSGIDFSDCNVPQTYYDKKDQVFFSKIEDQAHGLLLLSGYSQTQLEQLKQLRQEHQPTLWSLPITDVSAQKILADSSRARELVIRLETESAARLRNSMAEQEKAHQLAEQNHTAQRQQIQQEKTAAQQAQQHSEQQAAQEKANFLLKQVEQERALHRHYNQREHELNQQVHSQQLDSAKREQVLSEQTLQIRQEHEQLLRSLVQREREISDQLINTKQQAAQEFAAQAQRNREHTNALNAQLHNTNKEHQQSARHIAEQLLAHQVQAVQDIKQYNQQEQELHKQYAAREKELLDQSQQTQQKLEQLAQNQIQREQTVAAQMLIEQQQAAHDKANREKELLDQSQQTQQKLEQLAQNQIQREQAIAAQMLAAQQQAAAEKAALIQAQQEQTQQLEQRYAEREAELLAQTHSTQEKLEQLLLTQAQREAELLAQTHSTQEKLEQLLLTQVQREQSIATQIQAARQQAEQEQAELTQQYQNQEQTLRKQSASREQVLTERNQLTQQKLENFLISQVQREQSLAEQRFAEQQQADAAKQQLAEQFQAQQQQLHMLYAEREAALSAQQQHTQEKLDELLRQQIQREQEIAAQALAQHELASQEKAELIQQHQQQAQTLQQQYVEQEHALQQQIAHEQAQQRQLEHTAAEQERTLNGEIAQLQQHTQAQAQQHQAEQSQAEQQINACHALEAQLHAEINNEQQLNLQLRQSLSEVQRKLAQTQASFSWRITAPLRSLGAYIAPLFGYTSAADLTDTQYPFNPIPLTSIESPTMSFAEPSPAPATTLDALLALHDQQFVACAYQSVLGRPADAEGFAYYLARLRSGHAKIQLLAQLKSSAEGKAHASQIKGLDRAVEQYRQGQRPIIGWCLRQLNGSEGSSATERKLRAIENQLFVLSNDSQRRFNQLEQALAGVHQLISQQTTTTVTAAEANPIEAIRVAEPEKLKMLSNRAKDIYFQLKTAIALQTERAA